VIFLIILAGLLAAMVIFGMSLFTTLPAPIMAPRPIFTPGRIVALPPIQTSSQSYFRLFSGTDFSKYLHQEILKQ